MKRFFLFSAILTLFLTGCGKEYDDTALKGRVDTLEEQVQSNADAIKALQGKLEEATQQGLTVTVTPITGGNKLTFSDGTSIDIMDGDKGADGAQGPQGADGKNATISIKESADGSSYVITFDNKEYAIRKGQFFSLLVESTEIGLAPEQSVDLTYTLVNADATVKVFVSAISGYTAVVDQNAKKVTLTAPAELPESGYVVITAVKNSTGEESSQYVKFTKDHLEVTADAEVVEAEGGIVTLTVNADCDYTVSIPEDCTWLHKVDSKSMVESFVYIQVDENTDSKERTATVSLISSAGVKSVVIVQKGKVVVNPDVYTLTPDDAGDQLAAIAALSAAELDGKTIHFTEGTYNIAKVGLDFSSEPEMVDIAFTGENASLSNGNALVSFKNVNATFTGLTFNNAEQPIRLKGGKTTFTECKFENNKSEKWEGAAVYMYGEAEVTFKKCTFNGNVANYGADIYMVDGNLTVDECQFTGSEAKSSGACVAMSSEGKTSDLFNTDYTKSKAVVKNCTFTNIKAGTSFTDGADDGPSGVISCVHGAVEVEDCTFDGCEGKSGTIVALGSRNGRWTYNFGNSSLKMNNCYIKNSSLVRLGLIYINGDGWGDTPKRRSVAFINNTTFTNTTSSTGNYGIVAHSGGNAGIIMMNNCTVYGDTLPASAGNGFAVNTDGYILVSNSTFVTETKDGFFRNGATSGAIKVINTIGINTKEGATGSIVGETGKPFTTDGHCIYGPANDKTADLTDAVKDATTATLAGYAWNETTGLVEWNGPDASFSKLNSSDFQAMFTGFGPKTPALYNEASAGEAFYNWLVEIDAVGKDARGNSRGESWWPGAYQN